VCWRLGHRESTDKQHLDPTDPPRESWNLKTANGDLFAKTTWQVSLCKTIDTPTVNTFGIVKQPKYSSSRKVRFVVICNPNSTKLMCGWDVVALWRSPHRHLSWQSLFNYSPQFGGKCLRVVYTDGGSLVSKIKLDRGSAITRGMKGKVKSPASSPRNEPHTSHHNSCTTNSVTTRHTHDDTPSTGPNNCHWHWHWHGLYCRLRDEMLFRTRVWFTGFTRLTLEALGI